MRSLALAVAVVVVGALPSLAHAGNDATLPRHLEASFDAQALDARFHRFPCDQPSPAHPRRASPRGQPTAA